MRGQHDEDPLQTHWRPNFHPDAAECPQILFLGRTLVDVEMRSPFVYVLFGIASQRADCRSTTDNGASRRNQYHRLC